MAQNKTDEMDATRPILEKLAGQKTIDERNSVDANLKLYDQIKDLEKGQIPADMGDRASVLTPTKMPAPTAGGSAMASAFKAQTLNATTSPLRANEKQQ